VLAGARRAGRDPAQLIVRPGGFIATGPDEQAVAAARERVRSRIAYYGSTPAYQPVLRLHGWDDVGSRLHLLSRERRWEEMTALVTDEMLEAWCLAAPWATLPEAVADRYRGIATEIALPIVAGDPAERERQREVIARVRLLPSTLVREQA
jgi:alkanesulfonate monooxygenase SsuD/methylene tetrahydromethanopterin reductase-like flavin-dependent oxidoreductase (luciferase family)